MGKNKLIAGEMKDEPAVVGIKQLVGLKPKMHSFW